MKASLVIMVVGAAAGFWGVAATNRQSWHVVTILFIAVPNIAWLWANNHLLRSQRRALSMKRHLGNCSVRPLPCMSTANEDKPWCARFGRSGATGGRFGAHREARSLRRVMCMLNSLVLWARCSTAEFL